MICTGNCRQGRDACPHEEDCDDLPPWATPYWIVNIVIAIGMICVSAVLGFALGWLMGY